MFYLPAIVITLQAPAKAGPLEDAAVLLSRFPAGAVPEVQEVMDAIETIARSGKDEHLPLLLSLVTHEGGAVGRAATRAVGSITGEVVLADVEPEERPIEERKIVPPPVPISEER